MWEKQPTSVCLLHALLLFQIESWFSYLGEETSEGKTMRFELNIIFF